MAVVYKCEQCHLEIVPWGLRSLLLYQMIHPAVGKIYIKSEIILTMLQDEHIIMFFASQNNYRFDPWIQINSQRN